MRRTSGISETRPSKYAKTVAKSAKFTMTG
jgi:hypothetical protein